MLNKLILEEVSKSINKAVSEQKLGAMTPINSYKLVTEIPKNLSFGDFAVNVSSLARYAKLPAPQIAQTIKNYIQLDDVEINTVAGFINFKLGTSYLADILSDIITNRENYGKHIRIFKTVIPVAITAAESSVAGQSIYEYDKNGTVAKAYAEFTREVIQCGEKQRNKHESSLSR